jgi:hypothetical protein
MGTITTILILVLYGLLFAGGIYFKSYFTEKGKSLATKEDFRELKSQTAELRQATKEIEAKIDNQIWSGQRQWELKRDALLATVSALRQAHSAIQILYSAYDVDMKVKGEEWKERIPEERKRSSEALAIFNEKRFEASLVCSKTVNSALETPASLMRVCIIRFAQGDSKKASDLAPRINDAVKLAIDFMRKELGFTPLSSESSAAPTPGSLRADDTQT